MGADPEQFGPAALRLVEAGFDVIDINFGCPVKKVLGRCRGGFLLSQPETALEIVARVREAVPPQIPVTVKMRRGTRRQSPQSRDNFYTIFDGAFARGVAAVTVHGRTVVQRYIGPSNWDILAEIKRHAGDRIVLGSGDLFSAGSLRRNDRTHGRRRRQHRPRRDRQSVDFPASAEPWPAGRCAGPACSSSATCWREHFRTLAKRRMATSDPAH